MAEFSNEEYLRALADNGDREAFKEYEQALIIVFFSCRFHWLKRVIRRVVGSAKTLGTRGKEKKGLLSRKRGKSCERI